MTPYYNRDGITIFVGDARDLLHRMPRADVVVTDPPFGVRDEPWDRFESDDDLELFTGNWIADAYENAGLVVTFFADAKLLYLRRAAADREVPYRRGLVWSKPPGSQYGGASQDGFWFDFEPIQVFGAPRFPRENPRAERFGVLPYRTVTNQAHGCEKPLDLLIELVGAYSPPGGLVLDPFCGSGTTLEAAKKLGRRAIGIEISEEFAAIAVERLRQTVLPFGSLERSGDVIEFVRAEELG